MKAPFVVFMMCVLAAASLAADEPGASPEDAASLIHSLPTTVQLEMWGHLSAETRKLPQYDGIKKKIEDAPKICRQLEGLIITGKSVFDYPGLLSVGYVGWNNHDQTYTLRVKVRGTDEGYAGFSCQFDKTMIIKKKDSIDYLL